MHVSVYLLYEDTVTVPENVGGPRPALPIDYKNIT
jgi:hypothetical protein